MSIPSHHDPGDTGHAADHNAIVDTLTTHDQSINDLQSATSGIFNVAGGNVSNITGTTTIWAKVNLPAGDRTVAPDTFQVFHGSNKIFWLDNEGKPRVKSDDPTHIPSVIDSVTGQTANLGEWRVNGVVKASIAADGTVVAPNITPGVWTDLALASGLVRHTFGHKPQYRLKGDKVEFRGCLKKSSGASFTVSPTILFTMPNTLFPGANVFGTCGMAWVASLDYRLEVDPDGTAQAYGFNTTTLNPTWLSIDNFEYALGAAAP